MIDKINNKYIIMACSTFNDLDSYKRHKSHIPQGVIHVTVDGKYKGFPYPVGLSNDGTIQVASDGSEIIYAPNLTEIQKRQIYFDICNKNTILIPIDSDEFLQGDWEQFKKDISKFNPKDDHPMVVGLRVFNPYHNKWDPRPRIFFNPHNVTIGPHHFQFNDRLTGQTLYFSHIIESVKLNHDYKFRHESYNLMRDEYQSTLIANENHL